MPTHNTASNHFFLHFHSINFWFCSVLSHLNLTLLTTIFSATHYLFTKMSMELRLLRTKKLKPIMSTITLLIILCLSSSTSTFASDSFISSSVLGTDQLDQPRLSTSRALLQAQKPCPINFEGQNYTIITSRCKGPRYPAPECCGALTEFACQFAAELNDLNNNCAQTMFSYINLNGGYPPGLFSNECKDSKRGLECNRTPTGAASTFATTGHRSLLSLLSAAVFFLVVGRIL